MGCDIHLKVQVLEDNKWIFVDPPYGYYDSMSDWVRLEPRSSWYDNRNYKVFSMLADVRNGYGFAGVPTGDRIEPINTERMGHIWHEYTGDENRSKLVVDREVGEEEIIFEDFWIGDHSFNILYLNEFHTGLKYWLTPVENCGVISLSEHLKRVEGGKTNEGPDQYCGGVSGPNILTIAPIEGTKYLAKLQELVGDELRIYVRVWWNKQYHELAYDFYTRFVPALEQLAKDRGIPYSHVRIVFGFDS